MPDKILQPSIKDNRSEAFEAIVARLQQLDLSVLDIYNIDTVDASALFDLASQFNVLGNRGWNLTTTEQQRRNLIKEAIKLHQKEGTPFAVKRVLTLVGYPNATIEENPGLFLDGSWTLNGIETLRGASLGTFIVTLDTTQSDVSQNRISLIVALINEWKNARSYLLDLRIGDISLFSNLLLLDGLWALSGDQELDGERNV
ncbi:MAG: phage tail protein I [Cyanobacteria bacterium P01_H01_bin.26]